MMKTRIIIETDKVCDKCEGLLQFRTNTLMGCLYCKKCNKVEKLFGINPENSCIKCQEIFFKESLNENGICLHCSGKIEGLDEWNRAKKYKKYRHSTEIDEDFGF